MDCHICGEPLSDPILLHPVTKKIEPCLKCRNESRQALWELERQFEDPIDEVPFDVLNDTVEFEDTTEG